MSRLAVALALVVLCACGDSEEKKSSTGALTPGTGNGPATSSGSNPPPAGTGSTPSTNTSTDAGTSSGDGGGGENCVAKGYPGNDKKIGAYCDEEVSCPFQFDPFLVCTAGHDPTGTHLFCTTPCSKDSECGAGAFCMKESAGSGCVPAQCGGVPNKD